MKPRKWKGFQQQNGAAYLFLLPYLTLFLIFFVAPVAVSMGLSFTYFNVLQPPKFIGFANYVNLFIEDDIFVIAVTNTLKYSFIVGPVGFFLSFIFAWLITATKRWRVTYTLIFYAPSLSSIGMTFIWTLIFSGDRYGILNSIFISLGIFDEPYLWLTNTKSIMPIIMFVALWMGMGTGFLAQLAGFQSIPSEMYEAGRVDGIPNRWLELWYITIPMMKPYLLVAAVLQIVQSFAVFDIANALVGFPSPLYAGHTIVTHLWDFAFLRFEMGYSSAIAMILFLATFGLNRILVRVLAPKEG